MLFLIYFEKEDNSELCLVSAENPRELKAKVEDMFSAISAEITEDTITLTGFDEFHVFENCIDYRFNEEAICIFSYKAVTALDEIAKIVEDGMFLSSCHVVLEE